MRITSGEYKNRKLFVPEGKAIRPTSDRMRQTLFNILRHPKWDSDFDLTGKVILDLFCGSGALGLESLSNGAQKCFFMDRDTKTVINNTGFLNEDDFQIFQGDATRVSKSIQNIDLVFMDPPYNQGLIAPTLKNLMQHNILKEGAVIIIEAEKGLVFDHDLEILDVRSQSQSDLHFLRYHAPI